MQRQRDGNYNPAGDAKSTQDEEPTKQHKCCDRFGTRREAQSEKMQICIKQGESMKNKAVKIGIIATIAPHIFCCGLPMFLAIVGLVAPDAAHFHLLPHWLEPWLFVFSGAMLALSWWLTYRDCGCKCSQCSAAQKSHKTQKIVLSTITIIFVISIILHIFSHH